MRVAIEDGLENVWQAVQQRGWSPIRYARGDERSYDAIVLTGMDDDLMGVETTDTKAPVIAASGLSADEVVRRLDREVTRKH